MFELFELLLASPVGSFIFTGLQDALYVLIVISDCDDCGFNDLGKLLFGGVLGAILDGVVVSILLRRMRERNPASSVISIRPSADDN